MIIRVMKEFARPSNTTAYSAGDVIGPASGQSLHEFSVPLRAVVVVGGRLESNATHDVSGYIFVVDSSSYAPGLDNAAITAVTYNDRHVCTVPIVAGTEGLSGVPIIASAFAASYPVTLTDTKIYAAVTAGAGFTPTSGQLFRLSLFLQIPDEMGRF